MKKTENGNCESSSPNTIQEQVIKKDHIPVTITIIEVTHKIPYIHPPKK